MPLSLTAALFASAAMPMPTCSWDRPGVDPFTGSLVESVDRYTDIPADVRAVLKQRMAQRRYDDLVTIRRDAIVGRERYGAEIRDMHFGASRVCSSVTRAQWAADHEERGLVYCSSGHCLLVPTVCRNLSRITRLPAQPTAAAGQGGAGGNGGAKRSEAAGGGGDVPASAATAADVPFGTAGEAGSFAKEASGGSSPIPAAPVQTTVVQSGLPLPAPPLASGGFAIAAGTPTYSTGGVATPFPDFDPGLTQAPVTTVPEAPAALLWLLGLAGVAAVSTSRRADLAAPHARAAAGIGRVRGDRD